MERYIHQISKIVKKLKKVHKIYCLSYRGNEEYMLDITKIVYRQSDIY